MESIPQRVRWSKLAVTACLFVACAGGSPPQVAPPAAEAPAASVVGPECAECFTDGEQARAAGDSARAIALFERGCEQNEAAACDAGARMHARGDGIPENDARAVDLHVRACELDHGEACVEVGVPMLNYGPRAAEGRALLVRGCKGGHAVSCSFLAASYQQGLGGPVDLVAAARTFARSCELGYALACTHYGIAVQRGLGVAADLAKARELYRRACDGGDALGCGNFAVCLKDGTGGPVDMGGAVAAFKRGCVGGNANSCNGLGVATIRGEGGLKVDGARALELFESSCQGGDPVGCDNLASLKKALAERSTRGQEPHWTTRIGSLTIGSGEQTATFRNVRATCGPFPLSLTFGVAAAGVRECLSDADTRRVTISVVEGKLASSSVEPDDATGRCVASALGRAPLRDLTCTFEAAVSR